MDEKKEDLNVTQYINVRGGSLRLRLERQRCLVTLNQLCILIISQTCRFAFRRGCWLKNFTLLRLTVRCLVNNGVVSGAIIYVDRGELTKLRAREDTREAPVALRYYVK